MLWLDNPADLLEDTGSLQRCGSVCGDLHRGAVNEKLHPQVVFSRHELAVTLAPALLGNFPFHMLTHVHKAKIQRLLVFNSLK
jgi:hypothetical protein